MTDSNNTYYIGSGDYFGKCKADDKFHNEMLPFLEKLDIGKYNIDTIAEMVSEIYSLAYNDGYDNCEHEVAEN